MPKRPVYAVTSHGLWTQRAELSTLLDADIRWSAAGIPFSADGVIGWGQRASGRRAEKIGRRFSRPVVLLEDGFLKSYAPGPTEPAHSYVVDRKGIYFDARRGNDLSDLIDRPEIDDASRDRARQAIAFISRHRLSKYNNAPVVEFADTALADVGDFVLLIDQVPGDASVAGAMADDSRFALMVDHARTHYPDATIVIRAHPAAGNRSLLLNAARERGIDHLLAPAVNPIPLVEQATAVYTVSSQLGFEALMAGRKVHCFGVTYYSHRGLTEDAVPAPSPRENRSLAHIFYAAYIDYSRYLDLHDRHPVSLEHALEQIRTVRDQRNRIGVRVHTGGLSPWKRRALDPFLIGPQGPAIHHGRLKAAAQAVRGEGGQIALWGSSRSVPDDISAVRFEDGFIRSRGLGVNLAMPSSLAMDGEHAYYDARGESRLERMLAKDTFDDELLARADRLVRTIIENGITKYNVGEGIDLPAPEAGRLKILVPGQVEKDASIRFGSPDVRSNAGLVAAVRRLYPDAYIVYKEHPDVSSGSRSGGEQPTEADLIVTHGNIMHWIDWCDRVETMTSLTGFEALIRDKPVGTHGIPFYAGWGLTDDRCPVPRRTRKITRDMLVAAALIRYPFYIHPLSAMPCSVEELIDEIARDRKVRSNPVVRFRLWLMQSINRSAVKIRDGRR